MKLAIGLANHRNSELRKNVFSLKLHTISLHSSVGAWPHLEALRTHSYQSICALLKLDRFTIFIVRGMSSYNDCLSLIVTVVVMLLFMMTMMIWILVRPW